MIGVSVQSAERDLAREFFELCKTPWEFAQPGRSYDVVLDTTGGAPTARPALLIRYESGSTRSLDGPIPPAPAGRLHFCGQDFPVYGGFQVFAGTAGSALLRDSASGHAALLARREDSGPTIRIGYDLFGEVRHLLTIGQPPGEALLPALELHRALLREVITRAGFPFIEIPPVPAGAAFLACLTHDIDHPLQRNHVADHTAAGFLYRATVGSLASWVRGRLPLRRLASNLLAALRLPFVAAGLAPDPWRNFDRYRAIEAGRPSTDFVIPRGGDPGRLPSGPAPSRRACGYSLAEIAPDLRRINASGGEVGLHGLDSWLDVDSARSERSCLAATTGTTPSGIRMHWLYFGPGSPVVLETAGFDYDSTVGYNETIGFRAGATQVFQPPGTGHLLELPLHIMDTSLFYPEHLNLTEVEAARRVEAILAEFERHGGAVTVNWHDRSIAPERQWDDFYVHLLAQLSRRGAWFGTATQVVAWFRQRRAVRFESVRRSGRNVHVAAHVPALDSTLPGLRIRLHKPQSPDPSGFLATGPVSEFVDTQLDPSMEIQLSL